ncbi:MAG: hypothetical protein HY831_02775 [Candidatus Aenigmarchaeota archaeon]|nr:hypothetical protein [Candidatus Aenigmarchaeota archaeon]
MVQVTSILLAVIIMVILLVAALVILSGAVPTVNKGLESILNLTFPKGS